MPEILDFHQQWNEFLLLHILASVLNLSHSNRCIVVSHCLQLPNCRWKGFPGGSVVKNLPAVQELQETWVWSLGQEDPLEKGMATHYSILAWRIPWTEEPSGLQSMGLQSQTQLKWLSTHTTINHRKSWCGAQAQMVFLRGSGFLLHLSSAIS